MVRSSAEYSLEERLSRLLLHFGIQRAHFAACMPRDWEGLAAAHPEMISSLTLVAPMGINVAALRGNKFPLLVVAGDRGRPAKDAENAVAKLPHATLVRLNDYFGPSWADTAANRRDEIHAAMRDFIVRAEAARAPANLPAFEECGEVAGISFQARGEGVPVVLMPLGLSPSQWQPLIPLLSKSFRTITLGGAALGMVAHLEARAHSGYMRVIRQLLAETDLKPGETLLEVGCGPGAIVRWLAAATGGVNPIVAVDVNRYLLREAALLARQENIEGLIDFKEGDAENLPLADSQFDVTLACTMLEEGDADRMLAELARVTKSRGRVGIVVRSLDMPRWVNLPLSPLLKAKVDDPGLFGGSVQENGCADASLYQRMCRAGLVEVNMLPQWASHGRGERLQYMCDRIAAALAPEELSAWSAAAASAEANRTFFVAEPFHCAVGTKP